MSEDHRLVFQVLEGSRFFQGFTEQELWRVIESGDWAKAEAGERIVTAGSLDLYMFVLVNGQAQVVFERRILSVLDPGDTFGEFGLMGERRSADVVAKTKCLLLRLNAQQLNDLSIELQVKLLKRILVALMARLKNINRNTFWNMHSQWR